MERLNDQARQLAAQYYPLAVNRAKKFFKIHPYVDWDEVMTAAHMAIVGAAFAFEPERNIKFITLVNHHFFWKFQDVLRGHFHKGETEKSVDYNALQEEDEMGQEVISGIAVDFNTNIGHYENTEEVEWLLKKLPKRHASIMRDIYVRGLSRPTTAKNHKLSRTRIASIVQDSKKIITEDLNYSGKFTEAKERNQCLVT